MSLSVEDRLEIQELYARYNHAIDFGKADAWAACFTPDGVFTASAAGTFTGTEALANFVRSFAERMKARHWTNNLVIEGTPGGAQGTCYLALLIPGGAEKPPTIATTAVYSDTLVKGAEGWRFSSRSVAGDA